MIISQSIVRDFDIIVIFLHIFGIISKLDYMILYFQRFLKLRILKAAQFQFLYRVENSYCTSWVLIVHPPYFIEDLVNFSFTVDRNFWLFSRVNLV